MTHMTKNGCSGKDPTCQGNLKDFEHETYHCISSIGSTISKFSGQVHSSRSRQQYHSEILLLWGKRRSQLSESHHGIIPTFYFVL
jgi:hypothetical protein